MQWKHISAQRWHYFAQVALCVLKGTPVDLILCFSVLAGERMRERLTVKLPEPGRIPA